MAFTERRYELSDLTEVGGGTSLTNNNSATFTTGKVGNAATFVAASSQYLSVNEAIFNAITTERFTMWGWFKLDSLGVNHGICGQGTSSYHCHVITTNKLRFRVNRSTGGTLSLDYSGTLTTGTWYFFVVEYDLSRSIISLEINRTGKQTRACTSGLVSNSGDWSIGSIGSSNFANGQIDQIGFRRDGLLTENEKDIYYKGGTGYSFAAADLLGRSAEIVEDYIDTANAYRWKATAKAAKLPGSGSQDGLAWVVTTFPDGLIDSDEATAEVSGAPTLRAALNEDGTSPIPIHVEAFTPAAGGHAGGAVARVWLNPGAYTAGANHGVWFFWIAGGSQLQPPDHADTGAFGVYDGFGYWFHCEDDPTDGWNDATANLRHTTGAGSMTSGDEVAGVIGNGTDFDGSNDGMLISSPGFPAAGNDFTVGRWVKPRADTSFPGLGAMHQSNSGSLSGMFFDINETTDKFRFVIRNTAQDNNADAISTTTITFNTDFYFVVGRFDDSLFGAEIFIDGASEHADTGGGTRFTAIGPEYIAAGQLAGSVFDSLNGILDEAWRYDGYLTDDQIATLYNNQNDPADFWDATAAVEDAVSASGDVEFTVDNASVAVSSEAATIAQNHVLAPNAGAVSVEAQTTTIVQNHVITVGNASVGVTVTTATFSVGTTFSPDDAAVAVSAQGVTITQVHVLIPADGAVSIAAALASILQDHAIVPANSSVAVSVDNATITLPSNLGSMAAALGTGLQATARLGSGISMTATIGT